MKRWSGCTFAARRFIHIDRSNNSIQYTTHHHNNNNTYYTANSNNNIATAHLQVRRSGCAYCSCRTLATYPKIRPRRVRVITCDVTGTLVSFRGTLEDHYLGAAEKCGVIGIDAETIAPCFRQAYKETSAQYPCFGGHDITAKEWWRQCVAKSFRLAGVQMSDLQEQNLFQRIYSTFGSNAAYSIFDDVQPFLRWARRNHIACGVLSNADERYGDSILPMLGLTHDELQFQCYSKDHKLEKPDPRFFMAVMKRAQPWLSSDDPLLPSEVLHIGNDFSKDFEGARTAGLHAALLDRYDEPYQTEEWKRRGVPVFKDLIDLVEYLGRSDCTLG